MKRVVTILALAAATACIAGPAVAQPEQEQGQIDPAEDRATAFRRVEGPQQEDVPGGPLLVAAYGVVWALILLYVLRLGMLQARVARDVSRLERSLAAGDTAAKKT